MSMNNKHGTPISKRITKLCGINSKESTYYTPNSMRKRVLSKGGKSYLGSVTTTSSTSTANHNENLFNTAFSQPVSASKTPQSSSSSSSKKKSTVATNSCYTPSSLYRSANSTPARSSFVSLATPKSSIKKLNQISAAYDNHQRTPECFSNNTPTQIWSSSRKSIKNINLDDIITTKTCKDVGEISNLTVAVRVRPLNSKECLNASGTMIVQVENNEVTVLAGTTADSSAGVSHSFQYDHAFWSANIDDKNYADQNIVFEGTGLPLIDKAFEGYNACLFAYGQTGSGKSYSMMGVENDNSNEISKNYEAGIIPRFCQELFRRIELEKDKLHAEIEVSYFEIYNEKIHDLLCVTQTVGNDNCVNQNHKNALRVREHPVWGPYVVDLSTHPVDSYSGLRNWLAVGNSQRATAATGMNDKSSRSHSIFNIVLNISELENSCEITTTKTKKIKQTKRSKISLVDLAGSERINHNGDASGERIREGVSINKSLLTLGKVIAALAESKKGSVFVPYRESVLTWLLRESLGGNSRTVMLATISPASIHIDETLATLRYACQARTIVNRVKVNEDPHDKIIRELRAEVERLQALRQDYERQKRHSASEHLPPRKIIIETSTDDAEVEALRIQLAETEKELIKAQKSWMERLKEAEDIRKTEMRLLRRKGLALEFSAEQKQACLVNLAADPILSGTLFYILPNGIVQIGRSRPSAFCQPDIVLEGPLVAFQHCSIENFNGKLFIVPENEEFETYLNGELVTSKKQMYNGDRLVIGGSHYFRISNPNCVQRNINIAVDYQLAHQEILHKQEEQLRQELDREKQAAFNEIELERAANEKNYKERVEMLELEKFKYKCTKELLETEKQCLEDNNNTQQIEKFQYTPFKSTLLDDIKRIMQHPSEENLHKTQLKVKEATQYCRSVGHMFEFKQSQVLDEFGIFRAVVIIIDKKNRQIAEWPTARLDVWLDIVRDLDINHENIFNCVDFEWKPITDKLNDSIMNDSINSSPRISLNLNVVKEAILNEPNTSFQKFRNMIMSSTASSSQANKNGSSNKKENITKSAILNLSATTKTHLNNNVKKMLIYDDENIEKSPQVASSSSKNDESLIKDKSFSTSAYIYLKDIQRSTLKLRKLCERFASDENSNEKQIQFDCCKKAIDQMEIIIFDLKATLTEQKFARSPTKTPKSVRFLLD